MASAAAEIHVNAPRLPVGEARRLRASKDRAVSDGPAGRRLADGEAMQQLLLELHNRLRSETAADCAAEMMEMAWDDELAAGAQSYAEQCTWAHDPDSGFGENLAFASANSSFAADQDVVRGLVTAWYNESKDVEWASDDSGVRPVVYSDPANQCSVFDASTGACQVGHYTQMVNSQSTKLGCGVAACSSGLMGSGGVFVVCRYSPAGNYLYSSGAIHAPYVRGAPCASCPDSCANSLCRQGRDVNRCRDALDLVSKNMGSDAPYDSCGDLIASIPTWCTDPTFEESYGICRKTCGQCTPASRLGSAYCAGAVPPAQDDVSSVSFRQPSQGATPAAADSCFQRSAFATTVFAAILAGHSLFQSVELFGV